MKQENQAPSSVHQQVQDSLPWLASGALTREQQLQVREHVDACAHCRADVELEMRMRAAPPEAPAGLDPERALARLMARLDPPAARPALPTLTALTRLRDWLFGSGWMPWALAGQGALVAGLVLQLMAGSAVDESYRALSGAAAPTPGNVIVVFRPDASMSTVQRILHANGARMIDGPTVTGAYVLAVAREREGSLIALLRAADAVEQAEVLGAKPGS